MENKRKTAGELCLKASSDNTIYDPLELGHALSDDIPNGLMECARRHCPIFDEKEFCVGYVVAGDPLLANVQRRKFFAMLYLPSPRPNQAVFLYDKVKDQITKRLWVLPTAYVMAQLSELPQVEKKYHTMKMWSDAFFKGTFWQFIRNQHSISMLSEIEYLNAHREELVKAGCKEVDSTFSDPFDFSKISIEHIVDTKTAVGNEGILDNFGQA